MEPESIRSVTESQSPIPASAKPNYGLDSPAMAKILSCFGLFAVLSGLLIDVPDDMFLLHAPMMSFLAAGVMALIQAALLLSSSLIGKLKERDRLIGAILWRGDEQVLDVGCGRGLLLIAAAKRLRTGRAFGVDTWRSQDLSDNWAEATMDNARLEGVEDRVHVQAGDARELPFEDTRFDVVLCSLTLHLFNVQAHREKAIREMVRVLKPGGRFYLLEMGFVSDLVRYLKDAGCTDVRRSGFRFRIYPPARVVSGAKPAIG
ncbi:MAG: class I SAM-dependent methyltransferase [Bryobacteraceae bacterium]